MPDTGPKGYLGSVGTATLRDWAEELLEERGGQVAAPVISYDSSTGLVSITSATTDAELRYTLDGSEPTKGSTLYSTPFAVSGTVVVKAKGYKDNVIPSKTVEQTIVVAHVYGVMWDYGNPSPALTRLTPSNDPNGLATETITTEPSASINGSAGSSPFDTLMPWAGMKMRNITNGVLGPWEDESGFSLSTADVMVYLPDMWVKSIDNETDEKLYLYIADNMVSGFTKHPASGSYLARYLSNSSMESVTDSGSSAFQPYGEGRELAAEKGAGWHVMDGAALAYIHWIYLIEFANFDSQMKLYGGYTETSSITGNTGVTDSMPYQTGGETAYPNRHQYRHLERIIGQSLVDGIILKQGVLYLCEDPSKYSDSLTDDYTEIYDYGAAYPGKSTINGVITSLLHIEGKDWLLGLAKTVDENSSYTEYVTDQFGGVISNSSVFLLSVVSYNSGQPAGLFALSAGLPSNPVPARLAYSPSN